MITTIEPLEQRHLNSPALASLLWNVPYEQFVLLEKGGGMAQAILFNGITVGIVTVDPNREARIAIHSDYQRRGIASAALPLAKAVAVQRAITWITAKTQVDRPSNRLLAKLGAVETRRTGKEVFYRVDLVGA